MGRERKAFTLVELIVVMLIVGILASAAISGLTILQKRSILTEALTTMGTIRTAENSFITEHGYFNASMDTINMYLPPGSLNGTYFSEECYTLTGYNGNLIIVCLPSYSNPSKAPQANKVNSWVITIVTNLKGNVWCSDPSFGFTDSIPPFS